MLKSKYKKILIAGFIILFLVMSIIAEIISLNVFHVEHCNISNCKICDCINSAMNFIENLKLLIFNVCIFMVIIVFIKLINKNILKNVRNTLIDLKVIQIK